MTEPRQGADTLSKPARRGPTDRLATALLAAILSAWAGGAAAQAAAPMRVMSMMQCTDQLLMLLLPAERISSVTYRAVAGAATPALAAKARGLRVNHGLAEEILAEKPDLIVAGDFSASTARKLAKQVGIPVVEFAPANSFADIRDQTRKMGRAVGASAQAEALIARMDAILAHLARTAPPRRIVTVGYDGGSRVSSRGTLFDAILTAAGGDNLAANDGPYASTLDLEQLLRARPRPDILLSASSRTPRVGADADRARHPVLLHAYAGRRLSYPSDAYACGTPYAADEAVRLRAAMLNAMRTPAGARP